MSPPIPISYLNTRWGRDNSNFDTACTSASKKPLCNTARSQLSHAPARRRESSFQSQSPSPQRGSITELPATRVEGYGQLMKSAQDQGFAAPSRASVRSYAARALPATPISSISADETMRRRSSGKSFAARTAMLPPTPTSIISAIELKDDDGRVLAVVARTRHLGLAPYRVVAVQPVDEGIPDSPTLGAAAPSMVDSSARAYSFDDSMPSAVDSLGYIRPRSPAWLRRMRKRARWMLKWMEHYQED